jgi:hypothetical protein
MLGGNAGDFRYGSPPSEKLQETGLRAIDPSSSGSNVPIMTEKLREECN